MINLLAGRQVVPELLQADCTPRKLADTILGLLADPQAAAIQREGFRTVLASLRPSEILPSVAAANAVLELLNPGSSRPPAP